jgi:hypothetical protein
MSGPKSRGSPPTVRKCGQRSPPGASVIATTHRAARLPPVHASPPTQSVAYLGSRRQHTAAAGRHLGRLLLARGRAHPAQAVARHRPCIAATHARRLFHPRSAQRDDRGRPRRRPDPRAVAHLPTPLVNGSGNARRSCCPFHKWAYALDGGLLGAPLAPEDWVIGSTLEYDCQINWKIVVETFMECYHHIAAHPETFERAYPARLTCVEDGRRAWAVCHAPARPDLPDADISAGFPSPATSRKWLRSARPSGPECRAGTSRCRKLISRCPGA